MRIAAAAVGAAVVIVATALSVILLADSSEPQAMSGSQATVSPAPTRDQLAIMVLPQQALGNAARGLDIDIGSGFTDNDAATEATLDPDDIASQLGRAGRIVGYDLSYSDLSLARLVRGSGVLTIGTSVELFRSARDADAFIGRQLRDARRLRGRVVEFGRLLASSTFAPDRIGHRTIGQRTTVTVGKSVHTTIVAVRVDALVASVAIVRADAKPADTLAVRLARALTDRIRLVVRDELDAQPLAVPEVGRQGRLPTRGPDLAAMALSSRDLPTGANVLRQGYVADRGSLASYERELGAASTRSRTATVESDLALLRNAREAIGLLRGVRLVYGSPEIDQFLAAWTDLPSVTVEQRPAVSAGDEAIALVFRFPTLGTELRAAVIHVRVGRVVGTLRVVGVPALLRFADVRPLVDTFAKRIRSRL